MIMICQKQPKFTPGYGLLTMKLIKSAPTGMK